MSEFTPSSMSSDDAYSELSKIVLGDQPLSTVLTRVAQLARLLIPGATEVSVTLVRADKAQTIAFAGELAQGLDERQYSSGRGPCLDAAVSGQTIEISDTATDVLYPEFSRACSHAGMTQTLSIGMPTLQSSTGALNIYGTGAEGPFTAQARDIAARFVGYAAVAMVNAALYAGALDEVSQMKEALASRAVIEQAKGMIMRDRRCSAEDAFDLLRDTSSRTNRKLRDVAQLIVSDAALRPGPTGTNT